jgi:CRP-like cAMP-binding protein
MHVAVDVSLTEYTKLQEQECRSLLQLLDEMGIATADRVYGPGDAIYNEGEYGDALYVLTSGVLKLFRPYSGSKEATLRLLKPWDIFGHLAFAGETRQRAYAEAVTECRVTKVPKIFVERAVRQEPQVASSSLPFWSCVSCSTRSLSSVCCPARRRCGSQTCCPFWRRSSAREGTAS